MKKFFKFVFLLIVLAAIAAAVLWFIKKKPVWELFHTPEESSGSEEAAEQEESSDPAEEPEAPMPSDQEEKEDPSEEEEDSDPVDSTSVSSLYVPEEDALEYDEASDIVYVNDIILLFFKPGTSGEDRNRVISSIGGTIAGSIPFIDQYQVKISPRSLDELKQICSELKREACVSDALFDQAFALSTDQIPDDPWKKKETWSEENPDGRNWWLEAIDAVTAWDMNDKLKTINIGVIDNGFDTSHEDLKNIIKWVSANNKKATHGTHVAGIIGAEANNKKGITGVMWKSQIYTFDWKMTAGQKINNWFSGYEWNNFNTLLGAVSLLITEKGAKIVNLSAGSAEAMTDTRLPDEVVNYHGRYASRYLYEILARGYDFVIVQSAGNGNKNEISVDAKYNGAFSSIDAGNCVTDSDISAEDIVGRVIVVGSAGNDGNGHFTQAEDSNAGSRVDICAPGVDIYSTVPSKNDYKNLSGTSMAAPVVTGVAAMVWSSNPALTGADVKKIVCDPKNTRYEVADNESQKHPLVNTYRLVNANLALQAALEYEKEEKSGAGLCTLAVGFDDGVAAIMQDGTVRVESLNENLPVTYKEIGTWDKITSIAYGYNYIVGLREDGTLRAAVSSGGLDADRGQCNIGDWKDIEQVAAGLYHTVGLKSDGTVVAAGNNDYGQCNVDGWEDIVMIAAGDYHTVGLKSNGTVVAAGKDSDYEYGPCAVGDWTNIKQITAGCDFTAGLCEDGRVKATEIQAQNLYPYGKPEEWNKVTFLAAGGSSTHLLALRDDGSVVGVGANSNGLGGEYSAAGRWKDMALLACGRGISVGVKKDGRVLAVGMLGDMTLKNLQGVRIYKQQETDQTE